MNQKTKALNRLNNTLDKEISEENQEIFTNMICYLRGANISEYNQELVRQDLIDMVLSAQKRGESIQTLIGQDFKVFCDNVIASLSPKTTKEIMIESLDIICQGFGILGIIAIVMSKETVVLIQAFLSNREANFNIPISLGTVISMLLILPVSIFIVNRVMKNSFKVIFTKKQRWIGAFMGVGIMVVFFLIAWLGNTVLFTINIFFALAIIFMLYLVHKGLERI